MNFKCECGPGGMSELQAHITIAHEYKYHPDTVTARMMFACLFLHANRIWVERLTFHE